ncbi:MAG: HTTM domain-containing protein [Bacteroidota bacterium]
MLNTWRAHIPIYPLITFRIIWGVLLMFSTARFVALGWIEDHYIEPLLHFKYYGFEWIQPLGLWEMYLVHAIMFATALFVTLGYYYRISAIVLFLTFTYTELIDLTYYLNHYYFVSLISFMLIFLPAHRAVSLDVRQGRTRFYNQVPGWSINGLKLMIAIVYVYAGLAKINSAWLFEALPLKIWLSAHDKMPLLGGVFAWEWTPYLFSWCGMLYDVTIVFFLLYPATRKLAFVSIVVFHTLTGLLFQIGVFPIVMIAVVTIFFSPTWHRKILLDLSRRVDRYHLTNLQSAKSIKLILSKVKERLVLGMFTLFFAIQLLFPWRFMLYDSNLFWSEEGYRFSWRVMLMEKSGTATFYVKDGQTGREGAVINSQFLNDHQEKQMAMQPDLILQFAHFLGDHYEQEGVRDPEVRAEVYVSLNGQASRLYIDNDLNLLPIKDGWTKRWWVLD